MTNLITDVRMTFLKSLYDGKKLPVTEAESGQDPSNFVVISSANRTDLLSGSESSSSVANPSDRGLNL